MAGKGKVQEVLYGVIRQRLNNLSRVEYEALRQMCHIAKNLYNQTLYNIRQHFFQYGSYLRYEENYHLLKESENYRLLNSNMAQQIIKKAHSNFETFFSLLRQAKEKNLPRPKIPRYLEKDGLYPLHIVMFSIKDGVLTIPLSAEGKKQFPKIAIRVPEIVKDLDIKEIKIVPIAKGKWFEVHYVYRIKEKEKDQAKPKKALGIDLGIDNLATCSDTEGNSFIIDGRRLKSINQWFNKELARLKSVYAKQGIKTTTKRLAVLQEKRKNQIKDYMHKTAKMVVEYCLKNGIDCVVVGNNSSIFYEPNLGKRNNQNMVFIPLGYLRDLIKHKCQKYGIQYVEVEEAYTSQADALNKDPLPKHYEKVEVAFSGKRIKRGLYLTKDGKVINADVNGSLNILRKAGFELNFSHIPVPRRYQVWGNGSMPHPVVAACEPASVDKAGRSANSTGSSIFRKME